MNVGAVLSIAGLMVTPTAVVGAVIHGPRLARAAYRAVTERGHHDDLLLAAAVPIEQTAARLGRLLREHHALSHDSAAPFRVHHLVALEAAITDCALDAATALDVPRPPLAPGGTVAHSDLGALLRALAAAGLVMPGRSELLLAGLHG